MKSRSLFVLLVASVAFAAAANAVTIAQWTFETSVPTTAGPISPEQGSGSASASHANGATAYSNPPGNGGSTESWSADKWAAGDYWQFQISSSGYQDISVSWDQVSSATGPGTFGVFWSLSGLAGSFTQVDSDYSVPQPTSGTWGSYSQNLSSIIALNDAAAVYFRLVVQADLQADGSGIIASGGTSRVDNFTVTASSATVPDTLPFAPLAVTLLGILALARRSETLGGTQSGRPRRQPAGKKSGN